MSEGRREQLLSIFWPSSKLENDEDRISSCSTFGFTGTVPPGHLDFVSTCWIAPLLTHYQHEQRAILHRRRAAYQSSTPGAVRLLRHFLGTARASKDMSSLASAFGAQHMQQRCQKQQRNDYWHHNSNNCIQPCFSSDTREVVSADLEAFRNLTLLSVDYTICTNWKGNAIDNVRGIQC